MRSVYFGPGALTAAPARRARSARDRRPDRPVAAATPAAPAPSAPAAAAKAPVIAKALARPQPAVRVEAAVDYLRATREYLEWLWSFRLCKVCGAAGPCEHREPNVDLAMAAGWQRGRQVV